MNLGNILCQLINKRNDQIIDKENKIKKLKLEIKDHKHQIELLEKKLDDWDKGGM